MDIYGYTVLQYFMLNLRGLLDVKKKPESNQKSLYMYQFNTCGHSEGQNAS